MHRQAGANCTALGKTLFLDNFPIFFYPNGTWTHPPTSKLFLDFLNFFNFAKPLRQLGEKRLEKQGHMALAFVDLEKAFDTVPRKMAMATLRWMGAPESEVKMGEAMYENTTGRVVVGSGMSNEFQVNIGLRQGSALSPLLFILVMELISRKISTTDALKKSMYADDLVIGAEHREELQGALEEWNEMFKKHG